MALASGTGDHVLEPLGPLHLSGGGGYEVTHYTWDSQNRLTGVSTPGNGAHAYSYDHRTRRVGVTSHTAEGAGAGAKRRAISFVGGLSAAEWEAENSPPDLSGAPAVEYTRGPDMGGGVGGLLYSLRREVGASVQVAKYNLSNGRGDIVAQSDQSAALTWTANYEAGGKRTKETGSNADKQRANSKDEDPTGLLNEGFRYRDLETMTWLSRDPAGFVDGPNLYAYVRQNPWTAWDPLGLEEWKPGTEKARDELLNTRQGKETIENIRKAEESYGPRLEKEIEKTKGVIASARTEEQKTIQQIYLTQLESAQKAWSDAGQQITIELGDPKAVSQNAGGGVFRPDDFKLMVDPNTFYFQSSAVTRKGSLVPGGVYIQATLAETIHHELIHASDRLSHNTLVQFLRWNNSNSSASSPNMSESNAVKLTNNFQAETGRPPRTTYGHNDWKRNFGTARIRGNVVPLDKAQYIQPQNNGTWLYDPPQNEPTR